MGSTVSSDKIQEPQCAAEGFLLAEEILEIIVLIGEMSD
jgi:hypothetical protein